MGCSQQGGRRDCQNIHQQGILATKSPISPSLKCVFPTITKSPTQSKLSETVGVVACAHIHMGLRNGECAYPLAFTVKHRQG